MDLISHVERKHEALIPEDYSATRLVYDSINKTDHGTCMICKKPVYEWNEKISRYNNLCSSKKCREEVRRIALERHIRVHNTPTLLNDPVHQEKMLSNRHISGSYNHSDGARITYTGKYEKAALEFMDQVMNIPSKDIQMPGPILEYEYNGEKHSWITDIYYIPANLIIEVKDGGNNPNKRNMPEYRGKQAAKEVMITDLGKFNYLRLTDNNFSQLLEALADIKYENMDQKEAPQVKFYINESTFLINEEVGGLPPRRATANWIEPCMVRNTGWETIAIGNDISDTMFVGSMDDEFKKITKEEYKKDYERAGESLIYNGDDSTEIFKQLMNGVKTITEAMNILAKPFRCLDELALRSNWYIMDRNKLTLESVFIENAILRENDIMAGSVNLNDTYTVIKGAVLLSYIPDKGYFIHTPNDYHLASEYYGSPEDIPQNLIDTMADLYEQYKQRGENHE